MISDIVKSFENKCIEYRRFLHAHPELSFEEFETTSYIESILSGIPKLKLSRPLKTGIIADLEGGHPGKRVGIRVDIDALPIEEAGSLPFKSTRKGVMHACGHDGHTAILLTAAVLLANEAKDLHGSVRFIFQHAEELPPGGAVELVNAGILDDVDEVYSIHLSSNYETGHFGIREGALTAATDRFDITIKGKGGHSAFPETCVDPLVIAAEVILSLQTIVSRRIAAIEPAVVSVCMIDAGTAYNIIPGTVKLTGSTRSFSRKTRELLPKLIEDTVKGACLTQGADYDFDYSLGYASVINDRELTAFAREVCERTFGKERVFEISPLMPGEDFAAFSDIRPGFFVELGAGNAAKGCSFPHHNSSYMMDEDALIYGVEYFYQLIKARLS